MKESKKQQIEIETTYKNMISSYANQSAIQATETDVALLFGANIIDENGKHVVNMDSFIRMSHDHFEKFVNNCNLTLKAIKEDVKE